MPLLAVLDECLCALTKISIQAEIGLDDAERRLALESILRSCAEMDQIIRDIAGTLDAGVFLAYR